MLEIRKQFNGANSVRVAEILYCIGVVYANMNNEEKAREYYLKSYELFRMAYGEQHYCTKYVRDKCSEVQGCS